MSLKDQLLKAGLVDKKKAKKMEAQSRQQEYDDRKGKKKSSLVVEQQAENALLKEQRETANRLNQEINARRVQKELQERLFQLVDGNKIKRERGNKNYFFFDEHKKIHRLKVYPDVVLDLAYGKTAICRLFDDETFFLIPRKTAETIAGFYPGKIVLLHPRPTEMHDDFLI